MELPREEVVVDPNQIPVDRGLAFVCQIKGHSWSPPDCDIHTCVRCNKKVRCEPGGVCGITQREYYDMKGISV